MPKHYWVTRSRARKSIQLAWFGPGAFFLLFLRSVFFSGV
jgi:hypothetical protein